MPCGKSHGHAHRSIEKQIIRNSLLLTEQAVFTKCAVSFYKHPLFSGSSIQQQAYGIVRAWNILDATGFLDENAKKIDINDHINTTLYEEALAEYAEIYGAEDPDYVKRMQDFYNEWDK